MGRPLTNRQEAVLNVMADKGEFFLWESGVWSYQDCPHSPRSKWESKQHPPTPLVHATWSTIQVMIRNGHVEVVEKDGLGNPTRVRVPLMAKSA